MVLKVESCGNEVENFGMDPLERDTDWLARTADERGFAEGLYYEPVREIVGKERGVGWKG